MTNRIHRTLAIATLLLGATAALAACGSDTDTGTAQPAAPAPVTQTTEPAATTPSTAPPTTPPTAPPIAEPAGTRQPGTTAPTQRPAKAPRADDGCPVDDVVLLRLVHKHKDFVPTSGLTDLTCYRGWAIGGQEIDKDWWAKHGPVQPVTFVFRYDPNAGRWSIASGGTGGDCPKSMPADVQKHFRYCTG